MTSVIPQPWPGSGVADTASCPLRGQGQNTLQQAISTQHQLYQTDEPLGQDYRYHLPAPLTYQQQQPSHPNEHNHRPLQLINQEYDQDYPHLYHKSHRTSDGRTGRDTSLRSKTAKRVSKALPPDPLMKQRQRSFKSGSSNKLEADSEAAVNKDLPLPPAPTFTLPSAYSHQQPSDEPERRLRSDSQSEVTSATSYHLPSRSMADLQHSVFMDPGQMESTPYIPPASKKGIVIDRPYSYYKVSPKEPQRVTKIDSPFGPPEVTPVMPSFQERPRNNSGSSGSSTYHTHPSQANPFVPPAQYQPAQFYQQYQSTTRSDGSRKEHPDQEDPVAAKTELLLTTQSTGATHATREKSNSNRHHPLATSPWPEKTISQVPPTAAEASSGQLWEENHPTRSHSNGKGPLQTRQQRSQNGGQGYDIDQLRRQDSLGTAQPTRKASGSNLLRMARQASGTALKGMGLSRKASEKNQSSSQKSIHAKGEEAAATAQLSTYEQNSQVWAQQNSRSQTNLQRRPYPGNSSSNQQTQDYAFSRTYEAELGRNRSLPDIKSPSSADSRTPVRGSSLTHPKANPGPFHNRQRSQHHLQHPYQAATAMSNEPITAATPPSMGSDVIQDAYGGTTDDWRQAQQAEKEAKERQNLRDSSPKARSGHSSINSVSTLNLPPTTALPTTSALNRSTSRMLLPDRGRPTNSASLGDPSSCNGRDNVGPEPTEGNTSLAKATVQPGGILSQLQAATEAGQIIDPAMGICSQKEGLYIQRSNTAPYPYRENRAITEEDEADSMSGCGSKTHGPLEYSKSEGYAAASRNNRQQKRAQQQQQHQHQSQPNQPSDRQQHQQQRQAQPSVSQNHPNHNELDHLPHQQPSYQVHHQSHQAYHDQPYEHHQSQWQQQQHHQHQRNQSLSRSRAMSNDSLADTNKDLPPTPGRTPQTALQGQDSRHTPGQIQTGQLQQSESQSQTQRQRLRSESQPESSRCHNQHHQQAMASNTASGEGALVRSMSPPRNKRISHERSGSAGQLTRGGSHGQHALTYSNPSSGQKERLKYGPDILPLPVIPSPEEFLKKNSNLGILPQDVLRTLDSQTIQKVITQAVIASRLYKALTLEEVESLKKEQEDLRKYVEQLSASLMIETRMRDASHSLIRLHESNTNFDAVKAATSQLNATTRKMDQIVQKTQQAMERLLEIQRLLLQHEGAVLNAGMRRLDGNNRELTRAVQELETARDREKEEKLKWKKEHSQLRIQSMVFPNPPGLEEYHGAMANGTSSSSAESTIRRRKSSSGRKSPSTAQSATPSNEPVPPIQQQQHDARLAALENYMKDLNEEISKKDERVSQLESQVRMVIVWADDFAGSLRAKLGFDNSVEESVGQDNVCSSKLQKQLAQLQLRIEEGFRIMEANAHELKVKTQEAEIAKSKALEFAATTLTNSSMVAGQMGLARSSFNSSQGSDIPRSRSRQHDHQQQQQQSQPSRLRSPFNRSKTSLNESTLPTQHHNNSDLNVILNESLLELDLQTISSSSSSSAALTPDITTSSASQHSKSPVHQRQDLVRRSSRSKQSAQPQPKDDLVIGDAHEEIKRLNAMVDELERVVKMKLL
ncbi:hypothetical protein BC939DRAFT_439895 [Gamsiella multidivaricata]|uniref:uncharacterized protein n=1 Tax=Gamsiella multidivaricata TaxID=101098 RepID=UPI00221E9060|nr:uncharacterized protein BC939DRAFT_439895 [Gamsiella multidivaricata]KAI7830207.1 hypothetical protein BC939DRAFT_439895 [Gamsiella multidivaricata]